MWQQSSKIAQLFCLLSESEMAQPDTFRPCLNTLSRGFNWAVYKGVATGGHPLKYPFLIIPKGALWIQDALDQLKEQLWTNVATTCSELCICHQLLTCVATSTFRSCEPRGHAPGHLLRQASLFLSVQHICPTPMLSLLPCLHTVALSVQVPILGHFGFPSHYPSLNPTAPQVSASISFLWEAFWALLSPDSVVPHIGPKIHPSSFVIYEDHMGQYCHCLWWRRSSRPGKSQRVSQVHMPMLIFSHRIPDPVLRGVLQASQPRTRAGMDCPYHVINIWKSQPCGPLPLHRTVTSKATVTGLVFLCPLFCQFHILIEHCFPQIHCKLCF